MLTYLSRNPQRELLIRELSDASQQSGIPDKNLFRR
jgi:hypothetical protein